METNIINFIHEGQTKIKITSAHENDEQFSKRVNHEVMFRKIIYDCIVNNLIDVNKNMIDTGCWIGDNTLVWAKLIQQGKGVVYAIDPSTYNLDYINSLATLNDLNNIQCFEAALSDKVEELNYQGSINHNSFIECGLRPYKGDKFLMSTYLDLMYEQGTIKDIDFIHLDVEGMEYKVICGGSKTIEKCRPIVTFELHIDIDKEQNLIYNHFKNLDYTVFMIDEILPGCRYDCRNFLAIPKERNITCLNAYNVLKKII
jgi:FkbM family methyltransferase